MKRLARTMVFAAGAILAVATTAGSLSSHAEEPPPPDSRVFEEPPPAEPPPPAEELHPITYGDGQTTTNDRCPIRKRKLNTKIEPVWVNQHPVGFC